jgi:GT2 family glycosyltransferase
MDSLDIIILNYNSSSDTCELYNLLSREMELRNVMVIDNLSTKSEIELLKANIPEPNLILNDRNLGYAGGNNIGLQLAIEKKTDYTLILNPDIRLEISTIRTLLKDLKSYPDIAVIGPRILYRNNRTKIYSDGGLLNKEKGYHSYHLNHNKEVLNTENPGLHKVDFVNGSCFLMNMEAVKSIGLLSEKFFLYFEETEFCLRANYFGFNCMINSNVSAFHSSSLKTNSYHYYMTRNRLLLARAQKEFVFRTYKVVLKKLFRDAWRELKKLNLPDSIWFSRFKAVKDSFL